MSVSGWIGVDLDGTLAYYEKWEGEDHIGEPIPLMVERVKNWLDKGVTVKVFTARVSMEAIRESQIKLIQDYCEKHIGQRLEVTCVKDFSMVELWDDRCVQVIMNTGKTVG